MNKKNNILAILRKPKTKHWQAFRFNTDIQDYVEDFMLDIYRDNKSYFLILESDLEEIVDNGFAKFYYTERLSGRFVVDYTDIEVKVNYYKDNPSVIKNIVYKIIN